MQAFKKTMKRHMSELWPFNAAFLKDATPNDFIKMF